eukprot:gnl/MRDRNA2_/MRDRNA2_85853_c0_seq4.p1 gnl/MRDRNA2_/MRDRNA2_85853_c0~~gnl/MRDRNA2_/MRDRNA2_85853_c0_seq4.p1  ORF type:complete len:235 (+),score=27.94 gnl/MRDRNA2_/MRDRNA2_85853_c0_seq4:66-770(+)
MVIPLVWSALLSAAWGTTLKTSQPFLAGSTDPTQGSTGWALTSHGISEKLFTVDSTGNVVGQIAKASTQLDKFSWEVHLKPGYKFSDGTAVTAKLVGDALTKLNKENSGAQASLGTMTMTPLDDLKLKIESERATPVMEAVFAEWPFVVYLASGVKYFFTGPYAIDTFVKDEKLELIPNLIISITPEQVNDLLPSSRKWPGSRQPRPLKQVILTWPSTSLWTHCRSCGSRTTSL